MRLKNNSTNSNGNKKRLNRSFEASTNNLNTAATTQVHSQPASKKEDVIDDVPVRLPIPNRGRLQAKPNLVIAESMNKSGRGSLKKVQNGIGRRLMSMRSQRKIRRTSKGSKHNGGNAKNSSSRNMSFFYSRKNVNDSFQELNLSDIELEPTKEGAEESLVPELESTSEINRNHFFKTSGRVSEDDKALDGVMDGLSKLHENKVPDENSDLPQPGRKNSSLMFFGNITHAQLEDML